MMFSPGKTSSRRSLQMSLKKSSLKREPGTVTKTMTNEQASSARIASLKKRIMTNAPTEEQIKVAVRMRPLNKEERSRGRSWEVDTQSNSVLLAGKNKGVKRFTYDKTFCENSSTLEVYNNIAQGIVASLITGKNGTIIAYGQTSAGKTYTMQGSGSIQQGTAGKGGIVHLAAEDIFRQIENTPDRLFVVRASFLEIYNEEVRDLLTDDDDKGLEIHEDPRKGVFVQSKEEYATDVEDLLNVLIRGEGARSFASTGMNERSSRSHTVFRVTVESRLKEDEDSPQSEEGAILVSTLTLVDLAGSESVRHTGASGERQKEGGMINKSLLALNQVMVARGNSNQTYINFRDSKLTRMLKPSLSGNARIAMICCATPSELYLEETRSTLQFASRAKLVKTQAQSNEVRDDRSVIRRLEREVAELRRQLGASKKAENLEKADQVGTVAVAVDMEAEDKLHRLAACFLNNRELVAEIVAQESGCIPSKTTDRRRSCVPIRPTGTPQTKTALLSPAQAKTAPRPIKKNMPEHFCTISPSSEIALLQEALNSKNDAIANAKNQVRDARLLVSVKESELEKLNGSNFALKVERDAARLESQSLAADKAKLEESLQSQKGLDDENSASRIKQLLSKVESLEKENHDLRDQCNGQEQLINDLLGKSDEIQEMKVENRQLKRKVRSLQEKNQKLYVENAKLKEDRLASGKDPDQICGDVVSGSSDSESESEEMDHLGCKHRGHDGTQEQSRIEHVAAAVCGICNDFEVLLKLDWEPPLVDSGDETQSRLLVDLDKNWPKQASRAKTKLRQHYLSCHMDVSENDLPKALADKRKRRAPLSNLENNPMNGQTESEKGRFAAPRTRRSIVTNLNK